MNFQIFTCLIFLFVRNSHSAQKKHVVFIVADDLGWNDVSFHGSNQYITPNIDALAYSGVILHNYYVLPLCSPSRAALLTGVHPIYTGMYNHYLTGEEPAGLPLNFKILPQYLKERGYTTRAVGKWHLGFFKKDYTPTYRGFDTHFGYWNSNEDYYTHHYNENKHLARGRDFRRGMNTTWDYDGQYATDLFGQESVDIINSHNASEPLFLYLAHLAVHMGSPAEPLQAPPEIIEKFNYIEDKKRRIFAAMVWKLDESVGKVVRALADKNMLNDTIIVFTTDNGGPAAGFNQNHASNWPLKGLKDTLWEGGVRGSAFIWSADLPHSKVSRALMHIQDWVPTILAAVSQDGGNSTSFEEFSGRNMWPVLRGEKDSEYDELIIQRDLVRNISALRKENWKLVQGVTYHGLYDKWYGPSGRDKEYAYNVTTVRLSPAAVALSEHDFGIPSDETIVQVRTDISFSCDYCGSNKTDCTPCRTFGNKVCLFDVSKDPCEKNNLAKEYPGVLDELMDRMSKYVPVAPVTKPSDPRANPKNWNNTWCNWMDFVDDIPIQSKIVQMAQVANSTNSTSYSAKVHQ